MRADPVEDILKKFGDDPSQLIGALQDIQETYNYLSYDTLLQMSEKMQIPLSRIYSLATFFKAFSLKPRGKYCISVCLGTACHVAGGVKLIEQIERELHVTRGGTTTDMNFSLDEVHCLGCCGLAPVVTVNEDVHGKLTLSKIPAMLKKYIKKD